MSHRPNKPHLFFRTLNSQDMNTVDANIRFTIMAILRGLSGLITTIIAISYTAPIFLVLVPPLGVCYYFLQVTIKAHVQKALPCKP